MDMRDSIVFNEKEQDMGGMEWQRQGEMERTGKFSCVCMERVSKQMRKRVGGCEMKEMVRGHESQRQERTLRKEHKIAANAIQNTPLFSAPVCPAREGWNGAKAS